MLITLGIYSCKPLLKFKTFVVHGSFLLKYHWRRVVDVPLGSVMTFRETAQGVSCKLKNVFPKQVLLTNKYFWSWQWRYWGCLRVALDISWILNLTVCCHWKKWSYCPSCASAASFVFDSFVDHNQHDNNETSKTWVFSAAVMSWIVSEWSGKCWCKGERELGGAVGRWVGTATSCNLVWNVKGS